MKRFALIVLALFMVLSFVYAEIPAPEPAMKPIDTPHTRPKAATREAPYYEFSCEPLPIMTNFYDYFIGGYSSLPLRMIPPEYGRGYFMTYHGRREAGSNRRIYFTHLDRQGNVKNNSEITNSQKHEGFPTLVVDPVSGKPFYAWHVNEDTTDDALESLGIWDAFMWDNTGLWTNIVYLADNPTTITAPNGIVTEDNEFIWPTAVIGPSPIDGMRRIYVSMRNKITHASGGRPSENALIAYADFDGPTIERNEDLAWNYKTVPLYDLWNVDTEVLRRPYTTICADEAGNIYYIGYCIAVDADGNDLGENDLQVLKCDNYGEGDWIAYDRLGNFPTWNPATSPTDPTGYFKKEGNTPYASEELYWGIINSGHVNAVVDNLGRLHMPALWSLRATDNVYFPALHHVKQLVFDPSIGEIEIHDVHPVQNPDDYYNDCHTPWDTEAPFGEPEYVEIGGELYLDIETIWPFPHWDTSAHDNAMIFHYNHIKMTRPNDWGWMVMVWQDSGRARYYNDVNISEYSDFFDTPEIRISISNDNGMTWSEPININNQETPEFSGIKPMYVFPADRVYYTGIKNGYRMGKIAFMFYDDFTWGSHVNAPQYHTNNDGGRTMFMELEIAFQRHNPDADDPVVQPSIDILHENYPNPFNPETTISYTMPAAGDAKLGIYNLRGQLVRSLVNERKDTGDHKVVWDGKDNHGNIMPSGIYFYRLEAGKHSQTRKMMLMK